MMTHTLHTHCLWLHSQCNASGDDEEEEEEEGILPKERLDFGETGL
jgi:hypothetical protein